MIQLRVNLDSETKAVLGRIADALDRIEFWLRPHLAKPGILTFRTREQIAMSQFRFTFNLPAASNPDDVAARQIEYAVNGVDAAPVPVDKLATVSPVFTFGESDTVTMKVVDADAAGNKASGDPLSFVVVDDVPPATPGTLSIASKEQV